MPYKNAQDLRRQTRRYYAANRERVIARAAKWNKENRERARDRQRRYRARHKTRCNERSRAWRQDNPHRVTGIERRSKLLRKYGLTLEQYDTMLRAQDGVCAVCLQPKKIKPLNVDHCHKTGRVRGLLCNRCNRCLGFFGDDADLLARAVEYLRQ